MAVRGWEFSEAGRQMPRDRLTWRHQLYSEELLGGSNLPPVCLNVFGDSPPYLTSCAAIYCEIVLRRTVLRNWKNGTHAIIVSEGEDR